MYGAALSSYDAGGCPKGGCRAVTTAKSNTQKLLYAKTDRTIIPIRKENLKTARGRKKGDRVNTCVDTPHTCADVSSTYRSVAYLARDRVFSVASILAL